MSKLKYTLVRDVPHPSQGTKGSAGIDFYAPVSVVKDATTQTGPFDLNSIFEIYDGEYRILVPPGSSVKIPSGVKVEIPEGFALVAFNRSSMAVQGFQVGTCVVDSDYQGEIFIHLRNVSKRHVPILPGQKIVQFLLIPVTVPTLEFISQPNQLFSNETERGEKGFGSTDAN